MDTVIISIYGPRKFRIKNCSWFLPELRKRIYKDLSPTEQQSTRVYLRHFILKPPSYSGYTPKADIYEILNDDHNEVIYKLKLEFSVPKLLYKNSLQEASENDLDKTLFAIKNSLDKAGISIECDTLANAGVSAVHFCKNVFLPKDIRMQEALSDLQRVDIGKVADITEKESKNGGRTLHVFSGTIERVFYDKIADAMRPKVKRKDKGYIDYERDVVERFGLQSQEVFRYEYRIKKAQTVMREINTTLAQEPKTRIIFKDLFTPGLEKTILLKTWHNLIQKPENQLALLGSKDNLALFLHILAEAKKRNGNVHSMNRAFIAYGLARCIKDHGAKEMHRAISTIWNTDHPERLSAKIRIAAELTAGLSYVNTVAFIDNALEQFKPIDLALLRTEV